MIRPHKFYTNGETGADNTCQKAVAARALAEFDGAVAALRSHGVKVLVFDDDGSRVTPAPRLES